MRAAVYEGSGIPLQLRDVARPVAGKHEAVVRVIACGVCGSDLHATIGENPIATVGGILGHETAGEIVEIGPDPIGDWKIGDRVFCLPDLSCGECPNCKLDHPEDCEFRIWTGGWDLPSKEEPQLPGAFAEYLLVSTVNILPIPDTVSTALASMVEPLATGMMCVRDAGLRLGDRVAIIGGGPVGQAAVLWARFFGARRIVVSEPVESRRNIAVALGATDVFDPTAGGDPAIALPELAGGPIDVVIEAVGRPGMLDLTVKVVRDHGRIIAAGFLQQPDSFDGVIATLKDVTIRMPGSVYTKAECAFILEMMGSGRVDPSPMITSQVSLDELPDAFEALRRPTDECKVLLVF